MSGSEGKGGRVRGRWFGGQGGAADGKLDDLWEGADQIHCEDLGPVLVVGVHGILL